MAHEIEIANLSSLGTLVGSYYREPPILTITLDPQEKSETDPTDPTTINTLTYRFSRLQAEVLLRIPVTYREASTKFDVPNFKAILNYAGLEEPDDPSICPDTDTWGHFDQFDDELRHTIPLNVFTANESKIITIDFEIKLQQWEWRDEGGVKVKGNQLPDLIETRQITVVIEPESVGARVQIVNPTSSKIPTLWKQPYQIVATVRNNTDEEIDDDDYKFKNWEIESNDWTSMGPEDFIFEHEFISEDLYVKGPSEPGLWVNWYESSSLEIKVNGPFEKTWNYRLEFKHDDDELPYTAQLAVIVEVESWRIDKMNLAAGNRSESWAHLVLAIAFGAAAACLWWAPPVAAIYAIGSGICFGLAAYFDAEADTLFSQATCPPEYDKNFPNTHEYKELPNKFEFTKREDIPEIFHLFVNSIEKIFKLEYSSRITLNRYLSALMEKNKKAARLQKEHSEHILKLVEDEIILLKDILNEISVYEKEHKPDLEDERIVAELVKFKNTGLPSENKKLLKDEGYTNEQVNYIDEEVKKMEIEDFKKEYRPGFQKLYYSALENHVSVLRIVKEINRIDKLSRNDVLRELLKVGLIDSLEFNKKRDYLNKETSYPTTEIPDIDYFYKVKLAKIGINTTYELLERCATPNQREKLAKITGISKKLILEWARIADLLRISGVGEKEAKLLREAGAETTARLTKIKEDVLDKNIKDSLTKIRWVGRKPTSQKIVNWVKQAKELKEIYKD